MSPLEQSAARVNAATAATAPDDPEPLWAPPIPLGIPGDPTPFPTQALPLWLAAWVTAEAESVQVPADLPATIALSIISAATQGRYTVEPRPGWIEPVNLYTAVVLPPAERKSAVFSDAMETLRAWEKRQNEILAPQISHDTITHMTLEAQLEAATAALKKAIKSAAGAMTPDQTIGAAGDVDTAQRNAATAKERLDAYRPIHELRLFTSDVTPEKVASLLVDQREHIGILDSEGGIFDIMAGRYGNGANFDIYLKAHSGDAYRVDA